VAPVKSQEVLRSITYPVTPSTGCQARPIWTVDAPHHPEIELRRTPQTLAGAPTRDEHDGKRETQDSRGGQVSSLRRQRVSANRIGNVKGKNRADVRRSGAHRPQGTAFGFGIGPA
jgi:hypothetical protein